ncbi:hypothetical protein ABZ553_06735 [Streptomyces sparsogenes]|uniref:hypothetical protein n=1 Tax=Streptomyces sparsogenes TaxID=67365 RepID=UPI0033FA2103
MSHLLRATALSAVLLLSGCAGSQGQGHAGHTGHRGHGQKKTSPSSGGSAEPASLTRIARAIGCEADVVTDAEELRQAACKAGKAQYTLVTFATDQGKRAWLSESKDYGGTYLVGYRWSVTAPSEDSLKPLRVKLGGTIETGTSHGGMRMDDEQGHGGHAGHH